jgi:hypothetical protein
MRRLGLIVGGCVALAALSFSTAQAAPSICDAVAGNLVTNCGFEGGTHSNTIGGNTNNSIPNGWSENAGFDLEPSFNDVRTNSNSGAFNLSIGNFVREPAPALSQTLTDVAGASYALSLFVDYGGCCGSAGAFFQVLIDGSPVISLDNTAPNTYTLYASSFTGTGSDTLTLTGNTDPSEWFVDDVVVTGALPAPEPGTLAILGLGLAGFALARRRTR